jgi:hypothetical protein
MIQYFDTTMILKISFSRWPTQPDDLEDLIPGSRADIFGLVSWLSNKIGRSTNGKLGGETKPVKTVNLCCQS